MTKKQQRKTKRAVVNEADPSYQPSCAQLCQD